MPPTIDPEVCIKCGRCVEVCPADVFRTTEDAVEPDPEMVQSCILCGHCMARCPTQAVVVPGFDYEQFADMPDGGIDPGRFADFLATRRSMRRFTEEPVDREILERIVQMAARAPMGVPPTSVEVTVFANRNQLEALLPDLVTTYEVFHRQLQSAIGRFFFRRAMGADQFNALMKHLVPLIGPMCAEYRERGTDSLMWGAPAMLLFHADRRSLAPKADCVIAATYAMLAAHSFGLGATMLGTVAPGIENSKALRARLKIPEQNECAISVIIGHPAHEFRRTIPREFKSVRWVK